MDQKIDRRRAVEILWTKGVLKWKLHDVQKKMQDSINKQNQEITTITCARRLGKCLAKGTEIMTPSGPIPIEDINPGDSVYGYNSDGTVSLAKVVAQEYQGEKEVFQLLNHNKVLAESTKDHRWGFADPRNGKIKDLTLEEANLRTNKIIRKFVDVPLGNVYEPHAYAIGALLGDGCSRQGVKQIHISSENDMIPAKVANDLNVDFWRQSEKNYTWALSKHKKGRGFTSKYSEPVYCNWYNEWCKDRYAHEKIIDLDVIKTWDRSSILALLAGLLDTDGSVRVSSNILTISFFSQSQSLVKAVQYCIHVLSQYKTKITKEKRNKYKNGPCYYINLRNNLFSKKLLKELSPYMAVERKKWKPQYADLNENNTNPNYVGIKKGNSSIKPCYDIQIDNDTNLYLLANGLVTHNSYLLCIMASEMCLSKSNAIVKYACPKRKMVKTIIKPIMTEIFKDCPPELKPEFKTNDGLYEFPNGSQIQLAGTDNGHHESLRGGKSDLWIVDEAGFCDELNYVVNTILAPTTDTTGGRGILASTPSKMPDHEFITEFVKPAEYNDKLIKYTIHDNPMMTPEKIASIIARYPGGENNPEYQREYLCEIVIDDSLAVIPEFTDAVQKDIITNWPKPPFYDAYVAMDIGFKDLTVALFAYHDFKNNVLVVEDELVMNGPSMTTDLLAEKLREKEKNLWTHPMTLEFKEPVLRVCDNNLIMINDLNRLHNLTFMPTAKDDKGAAINNVRMKIAGRHIAINPRCEVLIKHLKNAIWQKNRKEYERSPDQGHYDAIDALVYLVRNVIFDKNPYPSGYGIDYSADLFLSPHRKVDERFDKWKSMFKSRKSIKN